MFRAIKLLYDTTMMDTFHKHLSKLTECTIPRMNPNVSYGLWVTMMC